MTRVPSAPPCPLCGYPAERADCPSCRLAPNEPSLRRPLASPAAGFFEGAQAVPRGLLYLVRTRGLKRWVLPPLILTTAVFLALFVWLFRLWNGVLDANLASGVEIGVEGWAWLPPEEGGLAWARAAIEASVSVLEWVANAFLVLFRSKPFWLLGWFLLGSLLCWYCFSIVYEAVAGPFLDEIQSRLEKGWFGEDPRARIERPAGIPPERCIRLTVWAAAGASLAFLGLLLVPGAGVWVALLAASLVPLAFALAVPPYGRWLAWMARVEARATWASLQASAVTLLLLLVSLPLYFVPLFGYLLFGLVTGFATAVGLLDIPLERRGWPLRMRVRFILRNLPAMAAFGVVAGCLLAVPVLGPLLMVPSASVGGMWLVCRLDKDALRPPGSRFGGAGGAAGSSISTGADSTRAGSA